MSDITLAVGDGARRMTYAEIAEARGISLPSARRLVLRHRWPRQAGNDGVVRVTVPLTALKNQDPVTTTPHRAGPETTTSGDTTTPSLVTMTADSVSHTTDAETSSPVGVTDTTTPLRQTL